MAEEIEKTEEQPAEEKTATEEKTEAKEEPQTVPKERLDEVIKERDDAKAARDALQTNVSLMKANAPAPKAAAKPFDIYEHVGLDPEDPLDVPNQKQLKAINAYNQGVFDAQASHIRFLVDHPDYPELVGTDEQIRTDQFQEPFTEALKDPALLTMFRTSQTPQITAYVIAKLHQKNKAEGTKTTKKDAAAAVDEAVKNANRVKSVSNTKGGEAGLSEEGRYEAMSDEEFLKIAEKHGAVIA